MILWQFSGNDLVNNLYALESQIGREGNFRRRPFLENGAIVYRNHSAIALPFDSQHCAS